MSSSLQNAVLKGALAGLMAGALVACGGEAPPAAAEKTEAVVEKVEAAPAPAPVEQAAATFTGNTCAGHNVCKALGGCKVEGQNECKGQNPCKGKGGCKPA
jgi:hypothetical protein